MPRGQQNGPLHHWRRGLVGAVQDWAEGSKADAVRLVFSLIEHLELQVAPSTCLNLFLPASNPIGQSAIIFCLLWQDGLRPLLHSDATREAETNAFIVNRVKAALDVNKACATEEQRCEYLTGLAYVAPPRLAVGDKSGMISRVAKRLGVRRGRRSKKQGGRPFAFDKAVNHRADFDAAALRRLGPLGHVFAQGVRVLTKNGPAEIAHLASDGSVVVTYRNGDSYAQRTYASCVGKAAGSARLQHLPPSLLPPPRETRCNAVSDTTKKAVVDHAHEYCQTSPHTRDVMKRRTGPCTHEEKPAPILSDVRAAMYADFQNQQPTVKLSYAQWKTTLKEEVWYIKKAYRSTCLDRVDVNYRWHRETLLVLAELLAKETAPPQEDADADDRSEQPPDALMWVWIGTSPPMRADGKADGEADNEVGGEATGDNDRLLMECSALLAARQGPAPHAG